MLFGNAAVNSPAIQPRSAQLTVAPITLIHQCAVKRHGIEHGLRACMSDVPCTHRASRCPDWYRRPRAVHASLLDPGTAIRRKVCEIEMQQRHNAELVDRAYIPNPDVDGGGCSAWFAGSSLVAGS